MIGYVLLITFAVIMGGIVYQFLESYAKGMEGLPECHDGTSIFIKDINFDCTSFQLNLTLKNNGRFNLEGYFIHATNDSDQSLATIDLSQNIADETKIFGNSISFLKTEENSFKPNDETTHTFNLDSKIYSIEIIPVRFQIEDSKKRFVSCGDEKVKEVVVCEGFSGEPACSELFGICCDIGDVCQAGSFESSSDCNNLCCVSGSCCTPESAATTCLGRDCGITTNNCGEEVDCGDCTGVGEVCNISGQCVVCTPDCSCASTTCVGETCVDPVCSSNCAGTLEPNCTGLNCGPALNGCGNETVCGTCDDGTCVEGVCIVSSCDGVWNPPEDAGVECDGTPLPENCIDCICDGAYVPDENGGCILPTDFGCGDYCGLFEYLGGGVCQDNPQKCAPPQGPEGGAYIGDIPGADETLGNSFCLGDPYCCCILS